MHHQTVGGQRAVAVEQLPEELEVGVVDHGQSACSKVQLAGDLGQLCLHGPALGPRVLRRLEERGDGSRCVGASRERHCMTMFEKIQK